MNHAFFINLNGFRNLSFAHSLAMKFPNLSLHGVNKWIGMKYFFCSLVISQSQPIGRLIKFVPKEIIIPLFQTTIFFFRIFDISEAMALELQVPFLFHLLKLLGIRHPAHDQPKRKTAWEDESIKEKRIPLGRFFQGHLEQKETLPSLPFQAHRVPAD